MTHYDDPSSVQGLLEYAFKQLSPKNIPKLHISSRTDQGVHAFKSSAHIDLDLPYSCHPNNIVFKVNSFLSSCQLPIKLVGAQLVSNEFNARACVKWRKYLYRLAVIKADYKDLFNERFVFPIPITEDNRCYFIHNPEFDPERVKNVLPLFIGTKDFRTFMGSPKLNPDMNTLRTWNSIELIPSQSFYPTEFDKYYSYWDIHVNARSFLYKQIRRTVGVLIKVAQNSLTYNDVKYMFDNPSGNSWNPKASTAPSHGLYLYDMGYDEEDLAVPIDKLEEPIQIEKQVKDSIELKKEIIRNRIEKRRASLLDRTSKSLEKIKNHELLRSVEK
ncbi:Hypothetical protein CINCED_3A024746 [Cinara cedri]|nr:Hypothetical protein CINCED_3A024746 [Cinara cedri]